MINSRPPGWLLAIMIVCAMLAGPSASARISIVSAGAGGAPATISLRGAITRGDDAALEATLAQIRKTAISTINGVPFITVELDSPGGDVVEALDIGRTIYQNFLMTLVRPGHECVSACVFVLMAGAVHTAGDSSSIGLHRPLLVSWSHIDAREAHRRYDGLMDYLRQYFRQLGVEDSAFDLMMRTDSGGMRYFSPAELDRLHLRGEDPAWEKLYAATWAAATTPKPPAQGARFDPSAAPKLARIDQTYRSIVYMPGAYHAGRDYLAGVELPNVKLDWTPLDNGWQPLWNGSSILVLARTLSAAAWSWLQLYWWLLSVLALELIRAQPWPGDPSKRSMRTDQWRLQTLVNPASARAGGPA